MSDPHEPPAEDGFLEQQLRDERAARRFAESRLANAVGRFEREREKAAIWRKRAEERAARIVSLKERQSPRKRWSPRRTSSASPQVPHTKPPERVTPKLDETKPASADRSRRAAYPTVRAGYLAESAAVCDVAHEFDAVDLNQSPEETDLDMVIIEATAMAAASESVRDAVRQLAALPAHPPVLVLETHEMISAEGHDPAAWADVVWVDVAADWLSHTDLRTGSSPEDPRGAALQRRNALRMRSPSAVADSIVAALHLPVPKRDRVVSGLLVSNRPEMVVGAVEQFRAQTYPHRELVVGLHGFGDAESDARRSIESLNCEFPVQILSFPDTLELGECLNQVAHNSHGELLAKIDDDDFYGPNYLLDGVLALRQSQADVVAKATYFAHFESGDETVLCNAGSEEQFVTGNPLGATMIIRRATWLHVPFPKRPRRVDSLFLRAVRSSGGSIYSTNRYNFVVSRRASGHVWTIDDAALKVGSEHVSIGKDFEQIWL